PIFIRTPIAQRRQELMQQVTVRRMQLDHLETRQHGPARRRPEFIHYPAYIRNSHLDRQSITLTVRHRTRPQHTPAPFTFLYQPAAIPGLLCAGLPARMRQLYTDLTPL